MKPEGAMEFDTPRDLSLYAFSDAVKLLLSPSDYIAGPKENASTYTLRVASQGLSQAALLAAANGGGILVEIDLSYSPDEWSLHYNRYYPERISGAVWSQGA